MNAYFFHMLMQAREFNSVPTTTSAAPGKYRQGL
jgi:hypothetical protein